MEEFFNLCGDKVVKPADKTVKKRSSVYGLWVKDNKILLIQPPYSEKWESPGGGVESGENEIDALKREFFEETGYKVSEVGECLVNRQTNFYADDIDQYFYSTQKFYIVEEAEKGIPNLNPQEIRKIDWVDLKDAKNIVRDNEVEIISLLLDKYLD